jgi:hypothetical protein
MAIDLGKRAELTHERFVGYGGPFVGSDQQFGPRTPLGTTPLRVVPGTLAKNIRKRKRGAVW